MACDSLAQSLIRRVGTKGMARRRCATRGERRPPRTHRNRSFGQVNRNTQCPFGWPSRLSAPSDDLPASRVSLATVRTASSYFFNQRIRTQSFSDAPSTATLQFAYRGEYTRITTALRGPESVSSTVQGKQGR